MGNDDFKSGFVSIIGLPNVGKSTFLNALINLELSIVTPKPQTTRNNILGILNEKNLQIVFIDTPGMISAKNLFEKSMKVSICRAIKEDSDIICLLVEPELPPTEKLKYFEILKNIQASLFLIINKIDITHDISSLENTKKYFTDSYPVQKIFMISALKRIGIDECKKAIVEKLPSHPPYFPTNQITDRWERFYAAEIIRKWIFTLYADEIPYSSAVEVDIFRENPNKFDYVHANIHVSKHSHKSIIIGEKGRKIRQLRESSQKEIEKLFLRKIKLELSVKVTENWQNKANFLKNICSL